MKTIMDIRGIKSCES